MKALIVAGGKPPSRALLAAGLTGCRLTVACDRGLEAFLAAGLKPDIAVGDFDSADPAAVQAASDLGIEIFRVPCEKDETDLELAARLTLERGARSIRILGATGGRIDHLLGNLSVLVWLWKQGAAACMEDEKQLVTVFCGCMEISAPVGATLSVIPVWKQATVTASGLQYPLKALELRSDHARGISNRIISAPAELETDRPVYVIYDKTL